MNRNVVKMGGEGRELEVEIAECPPGRRLPGSRLLRSCGWRAFENSRSAETKPADEPGNDQNAENRQRPTDNPSPSHNVSRTPALT